MCFLHDPAVCCRRDNAALAAAARAAEEQSRPLLPIYIFDPADTSSAITAATTVSGRPRLGEHRAKFLHHAVNELQQELGKVGYGLLVAAGPAVEVLPTILKACGTNSPTEVVCDSNSNPSSNSSRSGGGSGGVDGRYYLCDGGGDGDVKDACAQFGATVTWWDDSATLLHSPQHTFGTGAGIGGSYSSPRLEPPPSIFAAAGAGAGAGGGSVFDSKDDYLFDTSSYVEATDPLVFNSRISGGVATPPLPLQRAARHLIDALYRGASQLHSAICF